MLAKQLDDTDVIPMDIEYAAPSDEIEGDDEDVPPARIVVELDLDSESDTDSASPRKAPTIDVDSLFRPLDADQKKEVLSALRQQVSNSRRFMTPVDP